MITLIFKSNKAIGYSTLKYKSSDETEVLKEIDEEELKILAGQNWQDTIFHLKLENGEVVYDEEVVVDI